MLSFKKGATILGPYACVSNGNTCISEIPTMLTPASIV